MTGNVRQCFCCEGTWQVPAQVGEWWAHINTPEYEQRISTDEAKARIRNYHETRDLNEKGMLF